MNREQIIQLFVTLGEHFAHFGEEVTSRQAIADAITSNSWFSEQEIRHAVEALRTRMLDEDRLRAWLDSYPSLPVATPHNVLVVMAGNIPLVGFFDLLCVIASGNHCLVKPSSKDRVLMLYVIDLLRKIEPSVAVELYDGSTTPDAVIATGSDNAVRHFRAEYGSLPMLLRGSRSSVAILTGEEPDTKLKELCDDIYLYSVLGCRNISMIFVPESYNTEQLAAAMRSHRVSNAGFMNNYRQRRAILTMSGVAHTDLGHSLLIEERTFPTAISQINIARYSSLAEAAEWLSEHDEEIQCVACNDTAFINEHATTCPPLRRAVPVGTTQQPSLTDYPDALDVMEWLGNIG